MSILLFCVNSYNYDDAGELCGAECLSVSLSTALLSGVVYEMAYGTYGSSTSIATNGIVGELSYAYANSGSDRKVGKIKPEVSYGVVDVPSSVVQVSAIEASFPLYDDTSLYLSGDQHYKNYQGLVFYGMRLNSRRLGTSGTSGTSSYSGRTYHRDDNYIGGAVGTNPDAGDTTTISGLYLSVEAPNTEKCYGCDSKDISAKVDSEITFSYLRGSTSGVLGAPPLLESTHTDTDSNKLSVGVSAEVTYANENVNLQAEVGRVSPEIAYTSDDRRIYAVGKVYAEASYRYESVVPLALLSSTPIETCYSDDVNNYEKIIVGYLVGEATYNIWETTTSPKITRWSVQTGLIPTCIVVFEESPTVSCRDSWCIASYNYADGGLNLAVNAGSAPISLTSYDSKISATTSTATLVYNAALSLYNLYATSATDTYLRGTALYYVRRETNTLGVINTVTGDVTTTGTATSPVRIAVDDSNGRIYVGTRDGIVQCFTESFIKLYQTRVGRGISDLKVVDTYGTPRLGVSSYDSQSLTLLDLGTLEFRGACSVGSTRRYVYNQSDVSVQTATHDYAFTSYNRTTWKRTRVAILARPSDLAVRGGRTYYADDANSTVGWM